MGRLSRLRPAIASKMEMVQACRLLGSRTVEDGSRFQYSSPRFERLEEAVCRTLSMRLGWQVTRKLDRRAPGRAKAQPSVVIRMEWIVARTINLGQMGGPVPIQATAWN